MQKWGPCWVAPSNWVRHITSTASPTPRYNHIHPHTQYTHMHLWVGYGGKHARSRLTSVHDYMRVDPPVQQRHRCRATPSLHPHDNYRRKPRGSQNHLNTRPGNTIPVKNAPPVPISVRTPAQSPLNLNTKIIRPAECAPIRHTTADERPLAARHTGAPQGHHTPPQQLYVATPNGTPSRQPSTSARCTPALAMAPLPSAAHAPATATPGRASRAATCSTTTCTAGSDATTSRRCGKRTRGEGSSTQQRRHTPCRETTGGKWEHMPPPPVPPGRCGRSASHTAPHFVVPSSV